MQKQEKEKYFSNILEILQTVKNGIVSDCTEELMYTGTMPVNAQKELKVLANITGCVFSGLQMLGTPLTQDPNHDGLVLVTIDDKTYSCAKINLDDATTYEKTEKPLTVSEAYSVTINTNENVEIENKEPIKEETEQEVEENIENENSSEEDIEEVKEESIIQEENMEEQSEVTEETPNDDSYIGSNTENEYEDVLETNTDTDDFEDEVIEKEEEKEEEEIEEENTYVSKANIIGEKPITPSNITKEDFFLEESSKHANEFIYSISKITVLHPEIGSKPEEMLVMIAPLKVTKYSCPSVPIVVTILNRGKSITRSSYDILETGKNLVQIDINEFYFLCRGTFDDNGKFHATIVTTGISANQGDKINVISHKSYGDSTNRETRNGHVKFRYEAECGPGTIEVFPFGQPGEPDFVAIVKNNEFIDYYLISKSLRSSSRPIIYTGNGNKQELVCQWDTYDNLIVELVER